MNPTIIHFDGASKGNPGRGSAAAVLADNSLYKTRTSEKDVTNNVAEFHGLILAIQIAKENGYTDVEFRGDSQLVVKLITGEYKASNPNMVTLLAHAKEKLKAIPKWTIRWIPRAENAMADRLCNKVLESGEEKQSS
jgi:ribonuclease HI